MLSRIKITEIMKTEFVTYEIALELKELGFDEPCFNRFYTKPQSKMFGVDEKGRNYPIKNTSKKYKLFSLFSKNKMKYKYKYNIII